MKRADSRKVASPLWFLLERVVGEPYHADSSDIARKLQHFEKVVFVYNYLFAVDDACSRWGLPFTNRTMPRCDTSSPSIFVVRQTMSPSRRSANKSFCRGCACLCMDTCGGCSRLQDSGCLQRWRCRRARGSCRGVSTCS